MQPLTYGCENGYLQNRLNKEKTTFKGVNPRSLDDPHRPRDYRSSDKCLCPEGVMSFNHGI